MNIREIKKEDDSKLASIIRHNLEQYNLNIPGTVYFDPGLDNLSNFYLNNLKQRKYFVLENESGNILGGAGFDKFEMFENCAELQKIYLVDSEKGKGLGSMLLKHIEKTVQDMGYEKLYIETHSNLVEAIKMYNKFNFKRIDKPKFVQHSSMNVFFIKDLNKI